MCACPSKSSRDTWNWPRSGAPNERSPTVGLVDKDAASDIRDLRSLLSAVRIARHTAWQTVVRLVTTGLILALIAGVAIKLKILWAAGIRNDL